MAIRRIEDLRRHLQWAIEVEHSTLPPYMCALYSIEEAYAATRRRLIGEAVDQGTVDGMTRSVIPGVPVNAAATLVVLWSPYVGFALIAALALSYVVGCSLFLRD